MYKVVPLDTPFTETAQNEYVTAQRITMFLSTVVGYVVNRSLTHTHTLTHTQTDVYYTGPRSKRSRLNSTKQKYTVRERPGYAKPNPVHP